MPRADRLGDPLEGSVPAGEIEWWRREAANAKTEEARRIIEQNRDFLSRMAKVFREQAYYVSCWHMNPHENHAMWGCYTTQPESVAVRTTYAELRENLPSFVEMGIVRYIDYTVARLPSMNMFEHIMHKDINYRFEQEVRAVATPPAVRELGLDDFNRNHFELEAAKDFHVYAPPVHIKKLVHGIVLHPHAPDTYVGAVRDLCAATGLPAPAASRRTRDPLF